MTAYFFIQKCFKCVYDHYKILSAIMITTVGLLFRLVGTTNFVT